MYEYEFEVLQHTTMQAQLTARGEAGWRLCETVVHPTETQDEQPKIISFWEREVP